MDPKNIRSIEDWPTPTSVTDIRSILGLARYYRKVIDNFSRITCPMTTLQKKENKFLWTIKCEEIFQKLKQILTAIPILWIVDPDGDFIFFIDWSKERLIGVLLQNDYAIYYESWNLKEYE